MGHSPHLMILLNGPQRRERIGVLKAKNMTFEAANEQSECELSRAKVKSN